jgi:hypothetical protein
MECSCELDYGDYGQVDIIENRTVKARKEHICTECKDIINIGDKYERTKYSFDGDFMTNKCCYACLEIRYKFCVGAYPIGWMYDELRNCFDDISLTDFEELSKEAQIKIIDML